MGWLSGSEKKTYDIARNTKETVGNPEIQKTCGWTQEECAPVVQSADNFIIAVDACLNNRSTEKVHIKNDAKDNFKKTISQFANEHIRFNPKVPHDVQITLGLIPADEEKKESISYEAGPTSTAIINSRKPAYVEIRYEGPKPSSRCVCRIRYCFADTPPVDADLMTAFVEEYFGHNPWEHSFPDKRGKMLYYSLRWELTNGEFGQWSPVQSVVIP